MTARPYVIDEMISAKSIAARIEALCKEIQEEFRETDKLVVVGLLRGSFVFIADLVREIDLPVEVDFLEASSYGNAMESSREVRILKDLRGEIAGRDVLVVEDIVDTGHTLNHVVNLLRSGDRAAGVELRCALSDARVDVRAKMVVNAAGPWVEELLRGAAGRGGGPAAADAPPRLHLSKCVHLVVSHDRLPLRNMVMMTASDGRPVFVMIMCRMAQRVFGGKGQLFGCQEYDPHCFPMAAQCRPSASINSRARINPAPIPP